jgi:hypothetical protein
MSERIVKVSLPAWSESAHSWRLLTKRSPNKNGWSGGAWFSKKYCTIHASPQLHKSLGKAFQKKNIKKVISVEIKEIIELENDESES